MYVCNGCMCECLPFNLVRAFAVDRMTRQIQWQNLKVVWKYNNAIAAVFFSLSLSIFRFHRHRRRHLYHEPSHFSVVMIFFVFCCVNRWKASRDGRIGSNAHKYKYIVHTQPCFISYLYIFEAHTFFLISFCLCSVSRLLLRMAQTVLMYGHIIFLMRFPRHQVALANRLPQYKYFVMFFASFFFLLHCNKNETEKKKKTNSRCSQCIHIVGANT